MASNVFSINFQVDTRLLTKRGHARLARDVNRTLATRHKDVVMDRHFAGGPQTAAAGGYKYERRSKKWQKFKLKHTGRNVPLVFKGKLRQAVKASSRVTATQHKWSFLAKSYFPLRAERRTELQAVSKAEIRDNRRLFGKLYAKGAKSAEYKVFQRQRLRS